MNALESTKLFELKALDLPIDLIKNFLLLDENGFLNDL